MTAFSIYIKFDYEKKLIDGMYESRIINHPSFSGVVHLGKNAYGGYNRITTAVVHDIRQNYGLRCDALHSNNTAACIKIRLNFATTQLIEGGQYVTRIYKPSIEMEDMIGEGKSSYISLLNLKNKINKYLTEECDFKLD